MASTFLGRRLSSGFLLNLENSLGDYLRFFSAIDD